eukprot:scaffold7_cov378-Prasinococcus_capsulatus_cf.AAC.7
MVVGVRNFVEELVRRERSQRASGTRGEKPAEGAAARRWRWGGRGGALPSFVRSLRASAKWQARGSYARPRPRGHPSEDSRPLPTRPLKWERALAPAGAKTPTGPSSANGLYGHGSGWRGAGGDFEAVEAWVAEEGVLEISERVRGERSDAQPEEPWVRGC